MELSVREEEEQTSVSVSVSIPGLHDFTGFSVLPFFFDIQDHRLTGL